MANDGRIMQYIADGQNDMAYHDGMLAAADLLRQMGEYQSAYVVIDHATRFMEERRAAINEHGNPYKAYRGELSPPAS